MTVWVVCDVDTEFDYLEKRSGGNISNNPGLEKGVPFLLDMFQKYDLNATFHMQEQKNESISLLNKYPKLYDIIEAYDQEIGLHVHIKTSDYESRNQEISQSIERMKCYGIHPKSFRAGWYFTNTSTIKILENHGIQNDCSPVKNTTIGPMKWYDIPDSPYFPSYSNITTIGDASVLMIPIIDYRLGINHYSSELSKDISLIKNAINHVFNAADSIDAPVLLYFTFHPWKAIQFNDVAPWFSKRMNAIFSYLSDFDFISYDVESIGENWRKGKNQPYFLNYPDLLGPTMPFMNPARHLKLSKYFFSSLMEMRYNKTGKLKLPRMMPK